MIIIIKIYSALITNTKYEQRCSAKRTFTPL